MISAFVLTVAMSATAAPPGLVVNHAHPGHYTQPTIREYERFNTDFCRRTKYDEYVARLDEAWKTYRRGGSTPEGFTQYKALARQLKMEYVCKDPYLTMVRPGTGMPGANSSTDAGHGVADCPCANPNPPDYCPGPGCGPNCGPGAPCAAEPSCEAK